jgi:hypothetical protein
MITDLSLDDLNKVTYNVSVRLAGSNRESNWAPLNYFGYSLLSSYRYKIMQKPYDPDIFSLILLTAVREWTQYRYLILRFI